MESIEDLLAQVKAEVEQRGSAIEPPQSPSPNSGGRLTENQLLAELKAEFAAQDRAELHTSELQKNSRQQARQQQIQQERTLLTKQAKEWLQNLEPLSTEGLWFEGFSRSYPSKLEAAIDYLGALQDPDPNP